MSKTITMAPRKPKAYQDVILELNYSQAIRDQIRYNRNYDSGWDEERIAHAAHFCKIFHNKTLNPYVIQKFLGEFKETVGFDIDY